MLLAVNLILVCKIRVLHQPIQQHELLMQVSILNKKLRLQQANSTSNLAITIPLEKNSKYLTGFVKFIANRINIFKGKIKQKLF